MRNFLSNYKLIGTILLIFTIGIASGTLGYNTEQRSIYEQQLNGIVLISVEKPQTKPEEDNINGLGTGFFIQDNLIMTNYHVVKDATLIEIVAYETQNVYEAEIYAFDEYADIALLQFKNWTEFSKENNHYIFSIEKTKPKIGSEVYTFGHPYGFEWTMTKGIVSALDRIVSANPAIYIQTDSKMGKGNSGGPLLNEYNKVIGVNTFIIAQEETYGFSLSNEYIINILDELINKETVKYVFLGGSFKKENNRLIVLETRKYLSLDGILLPNDILISIKTSRGILIPKTPFELRKELLLLSPGEVIIFNVIRGDETLELPVTLKGYTGGTYSYFYK